MIIKTIVEEMYSKGAFPGALCAAVSSEGVIEEVKIGNKSVFPEKTELTWDTIYDAASLSKILGPTMLAMRLYSDGVINLKETVGEIYKTDGSYKDVTLFDLLTHQGGFPPESRILWQTLSDPKDTYSYILNLPPEYKKGEKVVYSCLGYIILAHALELITQKNLEEACRELIWNPFGMNDTSYYVKDKTKAAPTEITYEDDTRCYQGVVHDETARFMRPLLSGNAGIFTTLRDMEKFVIALLKEYREPKLFNKEAYALFMTNLTPNLENSRSFGFCLNEKGWDGLAGKNASKNSFGHTGFTGTSIWIDPEKDRGAIILSNRVHPTRDSKVLLEERRNFHDVVFT